MFHTPVFTYCISTQFDVLNWWDYPLITWGMNWTDRTHFFRGTNGIGFMMSLWSQLVHKGKNVVLAVRNYARRQPSHRYLDITAECVKTLIISLLLHLTDSHGNYHRCTSTT